MATQSTQGGSERLRVVDEPSTPKQEAIVDEALDDPSASNAEIADRVQERLGGGDDDRPSPSWVSRIRSSKLAEEVDVDTDSANGANAHDDEATDGGDKTTDGRNALDGRTTGLESTVEELRDDVAEANERLRTVEALVVGEYTDDLVADVLRRRADDLDDRS